MCNLSVFGFPAVATMQSRRNTCLSALMPRRAAASDFSFETTSLEETGRKLQARARARKEEAAYNCLQPHRKSSTSAEKITGYAYTNTQAEQRFRFNWKPDFSVFL